ncbi:hypothetical protein, partial [Mesorhizobium sp. M0085]|uniref:hypothetical protein n=1 Tax=Mesorhizobium sp. M0085 TaxID=2956872 RepID=UPI00333A71CE
MSWSSQRYIEKGLADGRDPKLVKAAASEIERLVYGNPAVPAVLTLAHLADRCGVDYLKLRSIVARNENHYAYFRIRKRSGGHREEFRAPAGVRKSPRKEPAGHSRWLWGF